MPTNLTRSSSGIVDVARLFDHALEEVEHAELAVPVQRRVAKLGVRDLGGQLSEMNSSCAASVVRFTVWRPWYSSARDWLSVPRMRPLLDGRGRTTADGSLGPRLYSQFVSAPTSALVAPLSARERDAGRDATRAAGGVTLR